MYLGTEHVTSSPGYLMSNGMLERAIRTVKITPNKAQKTGIDPYLTIHKQGADRPCMPIMVEHLGMLMLC